MLPIRDTGAQVEYGGIGAAGGNSCVSGVSCLVTLEGGSQLSRSSFV